MPASWSSPEVTRHRPTRWLGREMTRRPWLRPIVWATAVLVGATVLIGGAITVRAAAQNPCPGSPTTATVAASGAQFALLDGLARRWTADKPAVGGHCAALRVVRKDSGEVASALG